MDSRPGRVNISQVAIGAVLVAWGLLLTLGPIGVIHVPPSGALWLLLIVVLGIGKVIGSDSHRGRRSGMWLVVIGLWLALSKFTVFDYHDTWPLLVVAVGAMMVWDVVAGGGAARSATGSANGR